MIGWGQDKIILKDGEEILCKVIKVTDDIIEYNKYSNLGGTIYSKSVNEVFMIKYETGEKLVLYKSDAEFILNDEENKEEHRRVFGILIIISLLTTIILVSANQ